MAPHGSVLSVSGGWVQPENLGVANRARGWRRDIGELDGRRGDLYGGVMHVDEEVDATGLLCPLPVLKARKRLRAMMPGSVLCLVCTDPAAHVDVPHFCHEAGHELIETCERGDAHCFFIRRATP